ncbi:50S ribosomal protein L3 [SAR202 cluster bacterium AD-804-J14_MRT_500m]|nr:50S ribosomal protein L3 [SAR202 cluster bacterium AD-804-J14_MRT_500m]
MSKALLGKKIGMSQFIRDDGVMIPVTVLEVGPCTVTQILTNERNGYSSIQIGFDEKKKGNRPRLGHLNGLSDFRYLKEINVDSLDGWEIGQKLDVRMFNTGEHVTVIGTSKGRGFAGGMKRHGFHGQQRTHGQSDRERAPGSIGAGTTPGRVLKGKKMAGHMGNTKVTVKNLEIIDIDESRHLVFLKGGVPGAPQGFLLIKELG